MNYYFISTLLLLAGSSNGYKILFMTPIDVKSHWIFMQSIVQGLLDRHHEVTVITANTWGETKPVNYTEVLIDPPIDVERVIPQSVLFEAKLGSIFTIFTRLAAWSMYGTKTASYALNTTHIQRLLHDDSLSFDLVISEDFFIESFFMFAHKFKAPLLTICPYGYSDFFDRQFGLFTPWSHVPHMILPYSDDMSFLERILNTVVSVGDWISRRFVHLPAQNAISQTYFDHLGELPCLDDLIKNISMILVNVHRSVLPPRPSLPGIAFIGGAHIKEPKPLPKDIQNFLDEAYDGAIYLSFGTLLKSSEMPSAQLKAIINALKQVKQRVLWKFDDELVKGIPSNVMIKKWMPQNDILAHKNVILFISHGGMFGQFESLYGGVPLIMIPFFGDQFRNAGRAQQNGYAKQLYFNELNTNSLISTIHEMTTNTSYLKKSREISAIFKENIMHPLDEAIWWIEYVAKFRGAKHLKSHAENMSWFSYFLFDVFGALLFGLLSIAMIIYFIIKTLWRRIISKNNTKQKKQ